MSAPAAPTAIPPSGRQDPTSLRAVALPLDGETDLDPFSLAGNGTILFAGDGLTLVGLGQAAELPLPGGLDGAADLAAVQDWLAAVPSDGAGHRGRATVTALGALPFDRAEPGRLVVPAILVARDRAGRQWATVVAPAGTVGERARPEAVRAELARSLRGGKGAPSPAVARGGNPVVTAVPPGEQYAAQVARAVGRMGTDRFQKVVLARSLDVRFSDAVPTGAVVRRLHAQEPSCTIFSVPVARGTFLGASPELLVRREGPLVTCHPLAGTVALEVAAAGVAGDPPAEDAVSRLLGSEKDRLEHRLVVEEIAGALEPLCLDLVVPSSPALVRLHTVAHFGSLIVGTLRATPPPSVLRLVAALHPTPAVGGVPRSAALACIELLEAAPRGQWAGPVGWVDSDGDGEWVIGIRSATVDRSSVRLTAGAGIVAGSVPLAELEETTVKLAPLLEAFGAGAGALPSPG